MRIPRSVAEEVDAQLLGRPCGPNDLVFTAPRGGLLDRAPSYGPTSGHLFPSETETRAGRLEGVRDAARVRRLRPQDGPTVVPLRETAGQ
jgi:hypothetical protein